MLRITSSARCSEPASRGAEADELQGDADAAGGLGLPDLAEAALAQRPDEPVAGDGLDADLQVQRHGDLQWDRPIISLARAASSWIRCADLLPSVSRDWSAQRILRD